MFEFLDVVGLVDKVEITRKRIGFLVHFHFVQKLHYVNRWRTGQRFRLL